MSVLLNAPPVNLNPADIDGDGEVDFSDLLILLGDGILARRPIMSSARKTRFSGQRRSSLYRR